MQMPVRNYYLSQLAHLIESNEARILHLFIRPIKGDEDHMELSVKLSTSELKNVISTLERYQYNITGVFQASEIADNFQSRFDYLIKYMNT